MTCRAARTARDAPHQRMAFAAAAMLAIQVVYWLVVLPVFCLMAVAALVEMLLFAARPLKRHRIPSSHPGRRDARAADSRHSAARRFFPREKKC